MFLNIVYLIISFVYGALTVTAGISQLKNKNTSIRLNCILGVIPGGLLVIVSNLNVLITTGYLFYILILGLMILHVSAIVNGLLIHGKLNLKHHIIRLIVSVLLIVIFILFKK